MSADILFYDTLDSTNEEARRLLAGGGIEAPLGRPLAIVAKSQTAGRGTQGRRWVSPHGAGVYLSIVHSLPSKSPRKIPNALMLTPLYTKAAGVACAETLRELFGLQIELKPVNDLYARCPVDGRYKKLGGILVESIVQMGWQAGQLQALISGIGINLSKVERLLASSDNVHPDIAPISLEELLDAPKWRQLSDLDDTQGNRRELLSLLMTRVDAWYQRINHSFDDASQALEAEYARLAIAGSI